MHREEAFNEQTRMYSVSAEALVLYRGMTQIANTLRRGVLSDVGHGQPGSSEQHDGLEMAVARSVIYGGKGGDRYLKKFTVEKIVHLFCVPTATCSEY